MSKYHPVTGPLQHSQTKVTECGINDQPYRMAFAFRLLVSVLLASRLTCALLGGTDRPRKAAAPPHRRSAQHSIQLTEVGLESSDARQLGSLPAFREEPQDLAADQVVPDEWDPDSVVADGPGSCRRDLTLPSSLSLSVSLSLTLTLSLPNLTQARLWRSSARAHRTSRCTAPPPW